MNEASANQVYAEKWIEENISTGNLQMDEEKGLIISTKTNTITNADRLMDNSQWWVKFDTYITELN